MLLPLLLTLQAAPDARTGDWQQDLSYRITASLDEPTGTLRGRQEVVYRNRSPDTLRTIAFHLYLNAFRPGSKWSDADSVEGRRRFNDLKDPDFGFNHVSEVRIEGVEAAPIWPFAPDSTVVRFALPRALPPGDSLLVTMNWEARPSTVPRRQGRRGRHFDFAQWYPRVVAYDAHGWNEHPLYPAGEFYGDFGTFLVRLDVPADQVIGATGVPLCGDPGWEAARRPRGGKVTLQRDWYGRPRDPAAALTPDACAAAGPGRKTVVWYAEDVHHFAMSMDPDYRYEEGDIFERPVRVLYQPGDERTWGAGVAVRRTEAALAWLNELFGLYPWPQLTNVHRIEGGGTEFPMMVMNGSPDIELIQHEVGHQYLMGILANNEWREGWLDEGFTSFQTTWFYEAMGARDGYRSLERRVLDWDLDGLSEPVAQPGERFSSFSAYGAMTYDRGELFYHQLRNLLGEETLRRALWGYYDRYHLRHVDEARFRRALEDSSHRDLSVFFDQWLRQSAKYDFAVRHASRLQQGDGTWRTTVEVAAKVAGLFPVEVWVYGERDTAMVRTLGLAADETVEVVTRSRPRVVRLDPRVLTHDWNMLNNQHAFGFRPTALLLVPPSQPTGYYLDGYFTRKTARDRMMMGWSPTAWFNDAGGWTLGVRSRSDYLDRFALNEFFLSAATGWSADTVAHDVDLRVIVRNPLAIHTPGLSTTFDVGWVEGRFRASAGFEKQQPRITGTPGPFTWGASLTWLTTRHLSYLDRKVYDEAGTLELSATGGYTRSTGAWDLAADAVLTGGYVADGASTTSRQAYGRATLTGLVRRALGSRFGFAARGFAGGTLSSDPLPLQRRIYLAGADPYQRFDNPFLRSRGAIFVRNGFMYHAPGGANLRGLDAAVGARQAYGLNLELEGELWERQGGLFRRAALGLFGDGAFADGDIDTTGANRLRSVADAGIGIRIGHRIGQTPFETRLDLPLWVSLPSLAQDQHPGTSQAGWRWTFSFSPPFERKH